jgi:hypothetical protein
MGSVALFLYHKYAGAMVTDLVTWILVLRSHPRQVTFSGFIQYL